MSNKNIHPKQHSVTIQMTDKKTEFKIKTTYGKEGDLLKLDTDLINHPAWGDKNAKLVVRSGRADKFKEFDTIF